VNRINALLITVDALRADRVGAAGTSPSLTPCIDALATEGLVFTRAYASGVPTYYSFPGIMASRHAIGAGATRMQIEPGDVTLAEHFRANGYRTAAFVSTNPYISRVARYDRGFDYFVDYLALGAAAGRNEAAPRDDEPSPRLGATLPLAVRDRLRPLRDLADAVRELYFSGEYRPYVPATRLVNEALAWIAGQPKGEPHFVWMHLMDAHAPYFPQRGAASAVLRRSCSRLRQKRLNDTWNTNWHHPSVEEQRAKRAIRDEIVGLYDACVRGADAEIGRLARTLKERNAWSHVAWAVTSDHGEEFLDHGDVFHAPSKLTEELVRVPLVMGGPGSSPQSISKPVSLIGLAPTLAQLAGLSPAEAWNGASLVDGGPSPSVLIESVDDIAANPFRLESPERRRLIAVVSGSWKLVWHQLTGNWSLYDLERDPTESSPVPPAQWPAIADELRSHAAARASKFSLRDRVRERVGAFKARHGR